MASKLVPKSESVAESAVVHPGYQFTFSGGTVDLDLQQLEFLKYVSKSIADGGGKMIIGFPGSTYAQVSIV